MAILYDKTLTLNVQVSDWEKSRTWYQDVLGLTLQYELPDMGWCEFEMPTPGVTLGLDRAPPGTTVLATPGVTPTLGVVDIDEARAHLESFGVVFAGDTLVIDGMVKLAYFPDPDGHRLCLAQSLVDA
ncbi:MAG: VOC family protein [Pseudomonadota bacterium]